ncbi:MAG TPA: class II aldolase/adducin family protein [Kiritimatiellia bacterium]|nr:class II aldolase/adducin family protein [Kiritimatiellia bacterium]HMO99688.1 class II aldolase/adducin family protein [Kiritimatiellia bacterium]
MERHTLYTHPRDELVETMRRIYRYRMTTTSGGNLSIRDESGVVWITPSQVDKGGLTREDIVCVHPDGRVEGRHAPSSELPFHQAIYAARPEFRGIVHAHPVALVAFSICRETPNTRLLHQAFSVCGEVGFAPYRLPGSQRLGEEIAGTFGEGYSCVIMENHGVVTGGEDLQTAFQRFETLEFAAKTIIKARHLGPVHYLNDEQIALPRSGFTPLEETDMPPPGGTEKELRRQLRDFVRRGYQQRLMISTEGSFSARLDEDAFLITPYRVDRSRVEMEDIVLVREGRKQRGTMASRAARNHRAIYRRHPSVNAIINAYTVNATAFSVSQHPFSARTIPESYIFLRDVDRLPYGLQFRNSSELAEAVSPQRPVWMLENDGVLVLGASILNAFDRLEVLESTAEAVINALPIGTLSVMPENVIDELNQAFPPP